jgi:hypothetical protein
MALQLLALPPTAIVLAGAATQDNPVLSWVSYGAVGVVAIAFFMDWIVSGRAYHRLEAQLDKALADLTDEREKNAALQTGVIETAIPAISKNAALIEAQLPIMQRIVFALDHMHGGPQ